MKSYETMPCAEQSFDEDAVKQLGSKILQIVQSIPYGGQHETYVREIYPVNEFRANLPA